MPSSKKLSLLTSLTAALGLLMILNGCASTNQLLHQAGQAIGKTQARVELGELPVECREKISRVVPQIGEKPRWTQKRWEYAADAADMRTDNCAHFYDKQKEFLQ